MVLGTVLALALQALLPIQLGTLLISVTLTQWPWQRSGVARRWVLESESRLSEEILGFTRPFTPA